MNVRNRVHQWCAAVSLCCLLVLAGGCAASGSLKVPFGEFHWDYKLKTFTLVVPAERCWELKFSDAQGNQVGSTVTGQGPISGSIPEAAVGVTYKEVPCVSPQDFSAEFHPHGFSLFQYGFLGLPEVMMGHGLLLKHLDVLDHDESAADVKAAGVAVGAVFPEYVTVRSWIEYEIDDRGLVVRTSLPERFSSLTVEINGAVFAELGSGTTAIAAGSGWATQEFLVPNDVLLGASEMLITQSGSHGETMPILVNLFP